tara:strand:- start:438 stop:1085 length:648 start_codon:yes stop_codon:yes gene_type:complete
MISVIICCNNQQQYDDFCYPALYRTNQLLKSLGQEELDIQLIYDAPSIFIGNNEGIRKAHFPIKVFMHQDVNLLQTSWLMKIVRAFAEYPEYGLLGFCGTRKLPSTGFWWEEGKQHLLGELYSGEEKKLWSLNPVKGLTQAECIDSYFMATNREVYFDEDLPGFHLVDMDYSKTFTALGYQIGVVPHRAWHIGAIRDQDTSHYLETHYKKWTPTN